MYTSSRSRPRRSVNLGFTLIELVTTLVLISALAGIAALIIVQPFRATDDIRERARLVDAADLALERMGREIRQALPNSIRLDSSGDVTAVEFVHTLTGGRYRRHNDPNQTGDSPIRLASDQETFDVLGELPQFDEIDDSGGGDCGTGEATCMNIYNTGQPGYDVYAGDNLARITETDTAGVPGARLEFQRTGSNSAPTFASHSPRQRFYLFDSVVSFVCDTAAGTLERHADYGLDMSQDIDPSDAPRLLADSVTDCSFDYRPGAPTRSGLLTMTLTLGGDAGRIELFKQIHVLNAP